MEKSENLLNESLAWYIFTISSISSLSSSPSDSLLDNSLSNFVPCPGAMVSAKDNFNCFFSHLYFCWTFENDLGAKFSTFRLVIWNLMGLISNFSGICSVWIHYRFRWLIIIVIFIIKYITFWYIRFYSSFTILIWCWKEDCFYMKLVQFFEKGYSNRSLKIVKMWVKYN